MKTVCHIISGFLRNDSRIFYRQSKSLHKHGFNTIILTNDGLGNEVIDGIKIISLNHNSNSRLKDIFYAKEYFKEHALKIIADIYQLHGPELIPLGLYLKKNNKIVFYDAHEDLPRDILEKESIPFIFRSLISFITEFVFNPNA